MVKRYRPDHDARLGGGCFHCGSAFPDTVDHVPPKIFLDKPYPDDLITVPSCRGCNSDSSDDEQYVASLIEVVVCGTTDPRVLERHKISKTLEHRPRLREKLARAATVDNSAYTVRPELERVNLVLEKIARGLWRFDTEQDTADLEATRTAMLRRYQQRLETCSFHPHVRVYRPGVKSGAAASFAPCVAVKSPVMDRDGKMYR